jgi:hypothetical protein
MLWLPKRDFAYCSCQTGSIDYCTKLDKSTIPRIVIYIAKTYNDTSTFSIDTIYFTFHPLPSSIYCTISIHTIATLSNIYQTGFIIDSCTKLEKFTILFDVIYTTKTYTDISTLHSFYIPHPSSPTTTDLLQPTLSTDIPIYLHTTNSI